jgi:hypothetical protein
METNATELRAARPDAAAVKFPAALPAGVVLGDHVGPGKVDDATFEKTILYYEGRMASLRKDLASLPEFRSAAVYLAEQLGVKE